MSSTIGKSLALVALGLILGLSWSSPLPRTAAAPARGDVRLGHPSHFVLATVGHPAKISYGPEHQIWYYADEEGRVSARYWLNEDLVVRIEGD